MTTIETLAAAGWIEQPDGRWLSPLTNRAHDERAAVMLASLPLTTASKMTAKERSQRWRHARTKAR